MIQDFIDIKLTVGAFPSPDQMTSIVMCKSYDLVINCFETTDYSNGRISAYTTEIYCKGIEICHIPLSGIATEYSLANLMLIISKLYESMVAGKRVYLHCRSGLHRSVLCMEAFYYMMTGDHYINPNGKPNMLKENCGDQPMFDCSIQEMERMLMDHKKTLSDQYLMI